MGVNSLTRDTLNSTVKYTTAQAGNSIYDVSSMVPIATVRATGSSGSMSFASIPQGYQDLMIVLNVRSDYSASLPGMSVYFNNTGATGWSNTYLYGNGSSATSARQTTSNPTYGLQFQPSQGVAGANATAGVFSSAVVHILNYANTSTNKTSIARTASDLNGSGISALFTGLWANTNAVSGIEIAVQGNFVINSTATLYGIKAVGQ